MEKLTVRMISSVRHLRGKGRGYKAIAKMLHLSPSTVYKYSKSLPLSDGAKSNLFERQLKREQKFAKKYARKRKVLLSEDLAEFTGALLGDGCLSEYFSKSEGIYRYEVAFTGSKSDFPYYKNFLQPVLRKHFGFKGRLFVRGDGSTRFHIKSKKVYRFFHNLGVETGKKTAALKIPNRIFSCNSLSLACIRGIANTDGSVFSQGRSNRLGFRLHMNAKTLLEQTKVVLERNGIFTGNLLKGDCKAYVLSVYRKDSMNRFLNLVGFSNEHHLKRIDSFNLPTTV